MIFTACFFSAGIISFLFAKKILKHPRWFYTIAIILCSGLIGFLLMNFLPNLVKKTVAFMVHGEIAGALWALVMWISIVPEKSIVKKHFVPIRGYLSVFAFIYSISHVLIMAPKGFSRDITTSIIGVLMLLIMFVLSVTSFIFIRKKMSAHLWLNLQKAAYVFYVLLYVHAVSFAKKTDAIIAYHVIFGLYFVLRALKALKNKSYLGFIRILIPSLIAVLVSIFAFVSVKRNIQIIKNRRIAELKSNEVRIPVRIREKLLEMGEEKADYIGEGAAYGYDGWIYARIFIEKDKITGIKLISKESDPEYLNRCEKVLVNKVIESQTTNVDAVSGATTTSHGILKAVENAKNNAESKADSAGN